MSLTTLYRLWSANGELLYVGISKRPGRRMTEHMTSRPWWSEVASATFRPYECVETATMAEALAIADEGPRYNKVRPPVTPDWLPAPEGRENDPEASPVPLYRQAVRWMPWVDDAWAQIQNTWFVLSVWSQTEPGYRRRLRVSHHGPYGGYVCDLAPTPSPVGATVG